MLITVTEEDIREGKAGTCQWCPIALAASKIMGACTVSPDRISFSGGRHCYLPRKAKDFIHRFDNGGVVKPFKFEVTILYANPL